MNPLPIWLRWFLVLPAAVGAYALLAFVGSIVGTLLPIPSFLLQLYYSALSPVAFVAAGAATAPSYKFVVALVLTIINAVVAAVIVTVTVTRDTATVPLWWLVLCALVGIVATISLCVEFKEEFSD